MCECVSMIPGVTNRPVPESDPGERVAVLPYFALFSFLAERDAPHPEAYVFWPVEDEPARQAYFLKWADRPAYDAVMRDQAAKLRAAGS